MLGAVLLISGLFSVPSLILPQQDASASSPPSCRSLVLTSGGQGNTVIDRNGHYDQNNLRIEPIYAKRMYADFRAGYDAMYIGYRIQNLTNNTDFSNLWLSLSDFTPGIQPVNARQNDVFIGNLNSGSTVTKFFFVKATDFTTATQSHLVTVTNGQPGVSDTTTRASCQADIDGVYRSISAKANKVTSITVNRAASLAIGDTFSIVVEGTPGRVGSGSDPDRRVMTLSPANSSSWPAGALQLESVSTQFRGVQQINQCDKLLGGRTVATNTSAKTVTFGNELVFPSVDQCASRPQAAYQTTYTFKVSGTFRSNPVVRPVSDIASGTQIKYTGGYPSELPAIDFSTISPPPEVANASVTKKLTSANIVGTELEAVYQVKAELLGTNPPDVVLDSVSDLPSAGVEFQVATFSDKSRTNSAISPLIRGTVDDPELRFMGPFTVSATKPLVLNYTVRYPLPSAGESVTYGNQAFGLVGSYVVFSNGETVGVQGVNLTITESGGSFTTSSSSTVVVGSPQAIAFQLPATTGVGASIELTGYSDSGLPLSYTSLTPNECAVSEFDGRWTLVALSEGSCEIRATQSGDDFYAAATPVTRTITIRTGQVITHGTVPVLTGSGQSGTLTVSSSEGLPVTLEVLTLEECSLTPGTTTATIASGTPITVNALLNGGTCLLLATQPGNETVGPAPEVTIVIGIGNPQHITVTGLQATASLSLIAGTTPQEFQPSPGSIPLTSSFVTKSLAGVSSDPGSKTDLPVTLTSQTPGVCAVLPPETDADGFKTQLNSDGETTTGIRILAAGTCTLQADQDGDKENGDPSIYAPAPSVQHSFIIRPAGTDPQTVTISVGGDFVYGDVITRIITATATSGLQAQFEVTGGTCTVGSASLTTGVTSAQVLFTTAGDCTIRATQPGNNTFAAATPASATISVTARPVTLTGLEASDRIYDGTTQVTLTIGSSGLGLSGVVVGDRPADIAPALKAGFGAPTGVFESENVGTHKVKDIDGVELSGQKVNSYTLEIPEITGTIIQRNLTLRPNSQTIVADTTPEQCSLIVVEPTELANGDVIDSRTVGCLFGGLEPTETHSADATISVKTSPGPAIVRTSDPGTDVTTNYLLEFQTATLTVQAADQVITVTGLTDLTIVYGEEIPEDFINAPSATRGGNSVQGTFSHKRQNGTPLKPGDRPNATNGAITIQVEFTESGKNSPSVVLSRSLTVKKRPLSYSVSINSKVYDGTTAATISSFALSGTDDDLSGVVSGDEDKLELVNSPTTGEFASANVGSGLTVTFTSPGLSGDRAANYTLVPRGQGTASITRRPLTYSFTPPSKVYDGTSTVSLSDFALAAVAGNSDSGVVTDDDVEIDTAPSSGTLASENVGSHSLTWTDLTLKGTKKDNYEFGAPTGVQGTITKRPITFTVEDHARFVDASDPDNWSIAETETGEGVGRVPGETRSQVLGNDFSVTKGTKTVVSGGVDYIPLTLNTPNPSGNYAITKVSGRLFLASVTFTVQAEPGSNILTDREVECTCEGFQPGTATFEINSIRTFLATVPVDADGNCASTTVPIPDSVVAGDHNLVLTGRFPTGEVAVQTRPVTLRAPVTATGPDPDPNAPPPTPNTPSLPPGGPKSSPLVVPIVPGPSASPPPGFRAVPAPLPADPAGQTTPPQTENQGGVQAPNGSGQTDGANVPDQRGQSPLASIIERSQSPENTFDLGVEGVGPAQLVGNGSSSRAGTRTVGEIREERLGGFDPGTALRVEVIGSRTTARFVISTLTGLDELVLIEQITRSSAGNRTDFAGLDSIGIGSPTGPQNPWSIDERESAYDLFSYSRLATPTKQSDLLGSSSYTWLNVEKGVKGYLPGSTIYLTATSSPVVFGEAQVSPNGEAIVTGDLAVELLGLGEHRIRVIGTRVFEDIQVDADGEVIIPDFVLEQILLFDMGTDATVIVTGNNPTGGVHTVMRVVPLDPVSPWWTLWVIAWTALLLLLARLRGMIRTFMEKSMAGGAVLVSSIPALYLGWTTTVTQVAWWGLLMGLGLSLAVWLVPSLRRREEATA